MRRQRSSFAAAGTLEGSSTGNIAESRRSCRFLAAFRQPDSPNSWKPIPYTMSKSNLSWIPHYGASCHNFPVISPRAPDHLTRHPAHKLTRPVFQGIMHGRVIRPGGGSASVRTSERLLIISSGRRGLADTLRFDPAPVFARPGPIGKFALPSWRWGMASWVRSGGGYLKARPLNFSEPRTRLTGTHKP
jgi:hypothetical protein